MWILWYLSFVQVFGAVDIQYDFYKAVGQIIYDKSGQDRHAVLGNSKSDTVKDMLQVTQRGIYSDGSVGADYRVSAPANDEDVDDFDYEQDTMTIGCMQFSENSSSWGTFFAHLDNVDDATGSSRWVIAMQTQNNDVKYRLLIKDPSNLEILQSESWTSGTHTQSAWNFHHMTIERTTYYNTQVKYYINNVEEADNTYQREVDIQTQYQTIFGHREYGNRDENNGYIAMCVVLDTVQADMSAYFTNSCNNGLTICLASELSGPITCLTPATDSSCNAWHGSCPTCYTGTASTDCDPCSLCGAGDQSCEFTPPDFVKCDPNENCHADWVLCNGNADSNCYSCQMANSLPNASPTGSCECIENYSEFALSYTCTECDVACRTWFGTDWNECHTCRDGYFKQSSWNKCQNSCPVGEWENTTTNNWDTSLTCATECDTCTNMTNDDCTAWASGAYALNLGNTQCRSWATECEEWNGATNDDWTTWASTYAMLSGTNSCRATWPALYYENTGTRTWDACDATCATCNGAAANNCLTCVDANAAVDGGSSCAWNLNYYNSATSPALTCTQCHAYCEECTATTQTSWQQCRSGYYMQTPVVSSATCNNVWQALEYANSGTQQCESCHGTWGTSWTGTAAADWSDWADANASVGAAGCVCNANFTDVDFSSGVECEYSPCASECATCVGPSNDDWKTCAASNYEQPSSSTSCRSDWPDQYYPNTGNNQCSPWILPCQNCSDGSTSQCITWADTNATSSSGNWDCNSGYYNSHGNTFTQVDCLVCDAGCYDWVTTSTNCVGCNQGYYDKNSVCLSDWGLQWYGDNSDGLCHQCNDACQTCFGTGSNQCLQCRDANAFAHPSGECQWSPGYYNSSTSTISCVAWYAACQTCTAAGSNSWEECNTAYFRQPTPYETYWLSTCPDGYGGNVARKNCEQCHATCATCDGGTSFDWLTCADPSFLVNAEGRCEICDSGYYWDGADKTCKICHTDCATWDASPACLTWSDARANLLSSGSCVVPPCPDGEFAIPGQVCQLCPALWATCTALDTCTSWVENAAIVVESGIWKCIESAEQIDDSCLLETQLGPVPTLQIEEDNNLLLSFDRPLQHQLTKNDIVEVDVTGSRSEYVYTWEVQPQSSIKYRIRLSFSHDDIPGDTTVALTMDPKFRDANGYQITTKSASGTLHEVEKPEDEDEESAAVKRTAAALGDSTSGSSKASISLGMAGGALTGDFGATWAMMNSLQIIAFIPMMSTTLPLPLESTLKGFLEFGLFPNFFEFMMDEKDDKADQPYTEASDFGFDSSGFLFNAGEIFSQPLVMLWLLLPLSLVLQRCGNASIANYFSKMLTSFHWSFFLRTWIEIYLEILVAAYLQILSPGWDNSITSVNSILGYVFFFGLAASPVFVTGFFLINRSTIAKAEKDDKFSKSYGSLFSEFKNDKGVVSLMFYAWFFLRRLIYVANLIYLVDSRTTQFVINIMHWVISLSFVSYFLPYLGRFTNFVAIFTEIATMMIFGLSASFEMGYDSETENTVMWTAIWIVFSIMIVNYIDMGVCLYIGLKALYQKWKNRKQRQVTSASDSPAKAENDLDKTNLQVRQIQETVNEPMSASTAYSPVKAMNSPTSQPIIEHVPKFGKPKKPIKAWEQLVPKRTTEF